MDKQPPNILTSSTKLLFQVDFRSSHSVLVSKT